MIASHAAFNLGPSPLQYTSIPLIQGLLCLISIARQVIDWFSLRHDSISSFSPSLHTYLLVLFNQICLFIHAIPGQELFSRLKDVSTSCFFEITFSNACGRLYGMSRS